MALSIETFKNQHGDPLFKALGHPLAADRAGTLIDRLAGAKRLALYDPFGCAAAFAALYDFSVVRPTALFVQDVGDIGRKAMGCRAQPVTDLKASRADVVFVAAFDARRPIEHIRSFLPPGAEVVSFDELRLPDDMIGHRGAYLDARNFSTNFAFFRDQGGRHTRLVSVNYWAGYGGRDVSLYLRLLAADGGTLAQWREPLPNAAATIVIDSRVVRQRFGLGDFTGQLFIHVVGAAGHDAVKYALDVFSDDGTELSATHDANAWPADFYAGLPAPRAGERVVLWIQNSHPCPIPAGAVGLNLMGSQAAVSLDSAIKPFGSHALDVSTLLPQARWPEQIEIRAGRHFVRPRYEVIESSGRAHIAHVNVERTDLKPDPRIPELSNLLGKGYLLPAPVLPRDRWRTVLLPTPMATTQVDLPLALRLHGPDGQLVFTRFLGRLPRDGRTAFAIDEMLDGDTLPDYGHLELVYDFAEGGGADGWMHALFRYQDKSSGHVSETSFGAHVFNTALTYRGEPQSYAGRPPGLSTRLFLRIAPPPIETVCHLIYAASTPWLPRSSTDIILYDGDGVEVAKQRVEIACNGSLFFRHSDLFDAKTRKSAEGGYVVVRDTTCRLFGYHGTVHGGAFSLDHMFGY
ncbi:MAG: hypothetical protein EXQ89_07405 [Rhodospirillaceae bacterium]|nr:hypothetical protein [Rhodospirillaceae bacterium]